VTKPVASGWSTVRLSETAATPVVGTPLRPVILMRSGVPGAYVFRARFYGDWNEKSVSAITAELEVTRHFGSEHEKRERIAIRVEEKEEKEMARVRFVPAGWE
jgi:hypothetical protein